MRISLSRCVWASAAVAALLLVPVQATPARLVTAYREVCKLIAVWDPNRTTTIVVAEPPRPSAQRWQGMVSGVTAANITVNYSSNFDPQAKAAFQAAVDIWATQISSPVPIVVDATWSTTLGSGVLGSASSNFVYENDGGGILNTFYHHALASRLKGSAVDPGVSDISAS